MIGDNLHSNVHIAGYIQPFEKPQKDRKNGNTVNSKP